MPTTFGQPIDEANASRMYNNFKAIKSEATILQMEGVITNPAAARFHCGHLDGGQRFVDAVFVFDKESIAALWEQIQDIDGGVIAFMGAREQSDSPDPANPGGFLDVDGRPTLLVYPFRYNDDQSQITRIANAGREHPGTGKIDFAIADLPTVIPTSIVRPFL